MLLKEFALISLIGFVISFLLLGGGRNSSISNIIFKLFLLLNFALLLGVTENYFTSGPSDIVYFNGLGIKLKLYLDLAGLSFIWLNALLFAFLILFVNNFLQLGNVYSLSLMLFSVNNLFFIAGDSLTFLIFWEAMLIPATLFLWYYSSGDRIRNALEFIIYNFGLSIFLVLGVLVIFKYRGAFEFTFWDLNNKYLIAFLLFLGIMVKTPVFPFHGWLINTYYNLPSPITGIFSGILSKYAIFAFYRFFLGVDQVFGLLLIFTIISAMFSAFLAWSQQDIKKIFTYMSMSHLNIMLAGGLTLTPLGGINILIPFAMFHGFLAFILFVYCSHLESSAKTLKITDFGAMTLSHPYFTFFLTSFLLVLAGFPLFGYFYLEFLVASSVFRYSILFGFLLAIAMSINLIYKSIVFYRLIFNKVTGEGTKKLSDLSPSLVVLSSIILILVLLITFYLYDYLDFLRSGGV